LEHRAGVFVVVVPELLDFADIGYGGGSNSSSPDSI